MNNGYSHGDQAMDWHAFTACRVVAADFGVSEQEIFSTTRGKEHIALARQVAMYLTNVVYQLNFQQVADAFRRDRKTVSHGCHKVEDLRDCPEFDERMERLEARLTSLENLRKERMIERQGRLATLMQAASSQDGPTRQRV